MTTDQVVALTTAQIKVLSTSAVEVLTSDQMTVLETRDIAVMTTKQVAVLSTDVIAVMNTEQIEALTMAQADILTNNANQLAALGTNVAQALLLSSPLVLDLNGDGVKTLGIDSGVMFDLNAEGYAVHVGWISPKDGFLALDRDHDGKITDGRELFGTSTVLLDGQKAKDGFVALAAIDTNHDGKIDKNDEQFNDLLVWSDVNQDGFSQSNELHSLKDFDITEINLGAHAVSVMDQGNWIGLESTYTTADGKAHAMADVWLQINHDQNQVIDLTRVDITKISIDGMARIDVSGNDGHGDAIIIDAKTIEKIGKIDLVVNAQTGSGHVQMLIQGDANDTVNLMDASHWHDGGTTVVDDQTYQVLTNGNAQLLIGIKVHHELIG